MAAPSRSKVLSLYKEMLKEGRKLADYNFRMYAVRRVRDAFRSNMKVTDAAQTQALVQKGQENLEVLKRQALIGQLFDSGKLVIESEETKQ